MTSRRPFWFSLTMKRWPYWCSKPVLWESNSFFSLILSLFSSNEVAYMLPQDWLVGPTWPLFQCLGTPRSPSNLMGSWNTTMADVTSCENVLLHYGKCESRRYLFLFRKRSLPFANGSDRLQKGQLCRRFLTNRPLALRSLVTNASFKQ